MKTQYLFLWLTIFSSFSRLSIQRYDFRLQISDSQQCKIARGSSGIQLLIQCTKEKNQHKFYTGQFTKQNLAACSDKCGTSQISSYEDFYRITSSSIEHIKIRSKGENVKLLITFLNADQCVQTCALELTPEKQWPVEQQLNKCQIQRDKCLKNRIQSNVEACIKVAQSCQLLKNKIKSLQEKYGNCQSELEAKQLKNRTLQIEFANYKQHAQSTIRKLKGQLQQIRQSSKQIEALREVVLQLQNTIKTCQTQVKTQRNCQATLQAIIQSFDKERNRIKQQNQQQKPSQKNINYPEAKDKAQQNLKSQSEQKSTNKKNGAKQFLFWFATTHNVYNLVKESKYMGSVIQRISQDGVQYNSQSDRQIPFGRHTFSLIVQKSKHMRISIGLGNYHDRNMPQCSCQDTLYYNLESGTIHINGQDIKAALNRRIKQGETFTVVTELKSVEQGDSFIEFYIESQLISKHVIPARLVKSVPYALVKTFEVSDKLVMGRAKIDN